MSFFKKESTQDKIDRLEIKLAGMVEVEETSRALINSASKTPYYFVEEFVKTRKQIAETKKEIEILKTKLQ